jgi:hypothetical protein
MPRIAVVFIFFAIVALWVITPWMARLAVGELSDAAALGDAFGSLNAWFSGLAFAGVVCAILRQRQELALQREELSLTREELRKSAEAQQQAREKLAEQAEVLKVTAHLNGLATLIQATSGQIEQLKSIDQPPNGKSTEEIEKLVKDRKSQIEEFNSLMHAIRCAAEYPYR